MSGWSEPLKGDQWLGAVPVVLDTLEGVVE